ncbi:MAG: UDP-3-O-acyl-N-acetylglucosamine deacetylase [Phycisphaerales bacterium]|nr:UDP-3-O-acyl-N-acetylglucosamine deacetylase [Phycisphaerales bacterium]
MVGKRVIVPVCVNSLKSECASRESPAFITITNTNPNTLSLSLRASVPQRLCGELHPNQFEVSKSPSMIPRRTLAQPVTIRGCGLFSSLQSTLTIHPAPAGHGLTFQRTDVPGAPVIPAHVSRVSDVHRRGSFGRNTVLHAPSSAGGSGSDAGHGVTIHTTEHLLAAMASLSITDASITLFGAEVPMVDASAAPFVEALAPHVVPIVGGKSGGANGGAMIEPLTITHRHTLRSSAPGSLAMIIAEPLPPTITEPTLILRYQLDYAPKMSRAIPPQEAEITLPWLDAPTAAQRFAQFIAPARTFCTHEEAQQFRAAGAFAHIQPGEVLVLADDGPVETTLRLPSEPARHKVLDMLGDLALAGRPISGVIVGLATGHQDNHAMARLLANG